MRLRTAATTALLTPVLALGSTACSDEGDEFAGQSAEDIVAAAETDMREAESLSMNGTITTGGEELTLDVALNRDEECTGSVAIGGGSAEFVGQGDASYIKGDEAFWSAMTGGDAQAQAVLGLVGEKWAKLPAAGGLGQVCDLDALLEGLGDDDEDDPTPEKGDVEDIDGREAIAIASEEDGETTTAWVATEAPHHILKVTVEGGDEPGEVTFSDFDEELDLTVPAEEDTVDLGQGG